MSPIGQARLRELMRAGRPLGQALTVNAVYEQDLELSWYFLSAVYEQDLELSWYLLSCGAPTDCSLIQSSSLDEDDEDKLERNVLEVASNASRARDTADADAWALTKLVRCAATMPIDLLCTHVSVPTLGQHSKICALVSGEPPCRCSLRAALATPTLSPATARRARLVRSAG